MKTLSMWTLIILLLSRLFTAGISSVTDCTGYRGHSVHIRCPYESGYETYIKYLCRGECSTLPWGTKDIVIESGSSAKDQRFSLEDDTAAGVFIITITDLRTEDGGTYWCGIRRSYPATDVYTEIQLKVYPVLHLPNSSYSPPSASTSTSFPSTDRPHSDTSLSTLTLRSSVDPGSPHQTKASLKSLIYINGGLVIIVMGLLVALTVLFKHKKNDTWAKEPEPEPEFTPLNTTPANPKEDDCIYQEIDEQQQGSAEESTVKTVYSTAEEPTDTPVYSTIDEPPNLSVYSTVALPQQSLTNSPSPLDA